MDFLKCFLIFSVILKETLLTLWKNIESSTQIIKLPNQQQMLQMCEDAATVLERQASREYNFGEGVYATP